MRNYKGFDITFNWHQWPSAHIISDIKEFNRILTFIKENHVPEVELTENGHWSKKVLGNGYAWTKTISTNSLEIIVVFEGEMYKFCFWPGREPEEKTVSGRQAIEKFRKEAGHLAKAYELTTNKEVAQVKLLIEHPMISIRPDVADQIFDKEKDNCVYFHIDINSAYPAGIAATTPELRDYFFNLYEQKKAGDKDAKMLLNAGIGAFQSLKLIGRRYPELSRRAIAWTNQELIKKTLELESQGCDVLAYNTDGMWVKAPVMPQISNLGESLGQWKIDHIVEKLRFKSKGAYEFIENGRYYPVIRGYTRLDRILPRNEWSWGDIYAHSATTIAFVLNKETQLIEEVEND